ncbi:phosphoglycolate phosphatase [Sulfitobacter sp. S190]|uniref:phosphoglycolate phosphatase n=1 Tax=Sulfitobacter sp. S190 TaxID=2867022 RepID=UPI0021A8A6BF|nr:phosphoglycolate phosphatase [Sulfitobacter sp. S190]UWR21925.1 phosphoglycolate phosphatase [Sulfitobacter sp. S190]
MMRIVFDLDGTLIDSAPDIRGIANTLLAAEGAAALSLAETHSFIGNGVSVFVQHMVQARDLRPADAPRLETAFKAAYAQAHDLTTVYPGVTDALAMLRAAGHRLGVCTNKPLAPAQAALAHFGLAGNFDVVIGGDSLPQRKPDPAPLHAAFGALGTGPTAYVGDSEVDARTAQAAEVRFALFTEGYRKGPVDSIPHTAVFDHFDRLPALLRGWMPAGQGRDII